MRTGEREQKIIEDQTEITRLYKEEGALLGAGTVIQVKLKKRLQPIPDIRVS